MTAKWRQFEKFVARVEQALAPSGAIVRSPDRIPDKITGEFREVDASIRYKVGTSLVLITIECRDRAGIEDVRWIEQIAQKGQGIGASITLAVSSSGFTDPAIKKAAALDIQTRTLTESDADGFSQWLKFQKIQLHVDEWALAELNLELYDVPEDVKLIPAIQESFAQEGALAPIFVRNADAKRFTVENIVIEWSSRNGPFFPDNFPADGTPVRQNLHQPLERGCFYVETTRGTYDVSVIHIGLALSRTVSHVAISRLAEYADYSSVLVQTAEWNLESYKLSLHRDLSSGKTEFSLTSDE